MTRWLLSCVLVVVIGVVGFTAVRSDPAPGESMLARALFVVGVYLVGCGAIGAMLDRHGWFAALAAWGPVAGGAALPPTSPPLAVNLALFPFLALAGAWAGRWSWRRFRTGASSPDVGGPR